MGFIQGATEFLPVSSSGHLAVFNHILKLDLDSSLTFDILLHLGTLIAIFVVFHKEVGHLIVEFFRIIGACFANLIIFFKRKSNPEMTYVKVISNTYRKLVLMIIISTIPTGILGIVGKDLVDYATQTLWMVGLGFFATSAVLILADFHDKGTIKIKNADYASSVFIGIAQGVATLPGISRSGSTIGVALTCGYKKETAIRYSFLMSIPPVLGAVILDLKDMGGESLGSANLPYYLVGTLVSGIVGYIALRWMLKLLKAKKYFGFAIYTGILGLVCIIANFVVK